MVILALTCSKIVPENPGGEKLSKTPFDRLLRIFSYIFCGLGAEMVRKIFVADAKYAGGAVLKPVKYGQ